MAFVLSACQKDVPRSTAIWIYVWREGFLPEKDRYLSRDGYAGVTSMHGDHRLCEAFLGHRRQV